MATQKLNKEDLVKLLTAMRDNSQFCSDVFHKDRSWSMSNLYRGEASAFDTAIRVLTKPEYAEHMWNIFCNGKDEVTA